MKTSRIAIIIALVACISLGLFYVYNINIFDADTLKTVDIRTGDFSAPAVFELAEEESNRLFRSLSSLRETSDPEIEGATVFDMTLLNRWNITKNYRITFTKDQKVFIQREKEDAFYEVDDSMFFFSHSAFDAFYDDIGYPELTVALGDTAVDYNASGITWAFRRLDGTWHQKALEDSTSALEAAVLNDRNMALSIGADKMPNEASLKITDNNTQAAIYEGRVDIRQLPVPEYDGDFSYELHLTWDSSEKGYRGQATVTASVVVDLPEAFTLSKSIVKQGDMIVITASHVNAIEDIVVEQNISQAFKWFVSGHEIRGYLPTNYNTGVGLYTLTIRNTETGSEYTNELEVVSRDFKVQKLIVDPNIEATTRNDAAYEEFRRIFNPVRLSSAPERYYDEPFILPTKGRLTTEFGEARTVNGALTSYRHNGIDIGASRGTQVLATNTGKVALAYNLILTGNTIIIDHGEGIFSVYEHMDSMTVTEGDMVRAGDLIGTVGSTGFSTGPHLHFMISYFDINLEPGYFIYGEPLTKENYENLMK